MTNKERKNKDKKDKIRIFTAIDTNQSSFIPPSKKKQLKLAKKSEIGKK